ncbi:hypothetical protein EXIGLDRAFT_503697 [Exidia glandulosa HHB12029]|uniref:Uncharacterized protein n=1 Tax=Exidia glandulosa HHB12029 TaxID=1314781 RepID=A0A165JD51_EXIGL|nr:hypothetical protein EXIGLDRAFT_503697 [Exidia glandulosa HHB12029]
MLLNCRRLPCALLPMLTSLDSVCVHRRRMRRNIRRTQQHVPSRSLPYYATQQQRRRCPQKARQVLGEHKYQYGRVVIYTPHREPILAHRRASPPKPTYSPYTTRRIHAQRFILSFHLPSLRIPSPSPPFLYNANTLRRPVRVPSIRLPCSPSTRPLSL